MKLKSFGLTLTYQKIKPHLSMVLVQIASAFMYFITEASFNRGLNPHVYVTYRHIAGGIVVLPFAYFVERKIRPKMTIITFMQILLFSLFGVGLTINMYFASLLYTSPTFVSATVNTIPPLTFILAVIFRLERLNIRSPYGLAKVAGTLVSFAGVMTITFYRGPAVRCLWESRIHITRSNYHKNWIKGPILSIASCVTWAIWFIMQGFMLKRYPAQLSLATWTNFLGGAQSAVFTAVILRHEPLTWVSTSFIDIATILFGGVVSSALNFFMLIWCTKQKGPVFVTIFCPLQTFLVVIFSYFILSEKLYMGSIIGGVTTIMGLYLFLWGKGSDDEVKIESQGKSFSSCNEQNVPKIDTVTEAKKERQ